MSLISHTKHFLGAASLNAKQMKMKELNSIETDLIIADDLLHRLKTEKGLDDELYHKLETQVRRIRILIKEKKMKIMY
jgi:hypothetical protein